MYDISLALAKILDESTEFKTYCNDIIGEEFVYYVHVDMGRVSKIETPYFSFVTYTDRNTVGEDAQVLIQMLTGIDRSDVITEDNIISEDSQLLLEKVTRKALEIIDKDMSVFGLNGEKGFIKEYLNIFASPPLGEDDIQLQIDMILNTKKCL
jgi:hypothetical protein